MEKDIEICVTRLFAFEKGVKRWMAVAGGNMEIFGYLNLEGNTAISLPRHPILDLTEEEKKVWLQCFGEPLKVPKDLLTRIPIADILTQGEEKRDMYRECIAFTKNSRFRNKNYKPKAKEPTKTKPKRKMDINPKKRSVPPFTKGKPLIRGKRPRQKYPPKKRR